jgi:hypothetical protein
MRLKQPTRLLGLSLVVSLSMLALTASGAQANDGSVFFSGNPHATLGTAVEIDGELLESWELLVEVLGLEIDCAKADLKGKILPAGAVEALALFLECVVLGAESDCTILPAPGSSSSGQFHLTFNGLLRKKASGKHYLLITGLGAGKLLARMVVEGEFCPLDGMDEQLNGETVLELPDALNLSAHHILKPLLHSEILALGFLESLSFGINPMELHKGRILALRAGSTTVWGVL